MKTELIKIAQDLEQGKITESEARTLLLGLLNVSVSLPTDYEITSLARKYSDKNDTCSFNFYGNCNVNPRFRNDIIELVKRCNER